jgi:hypothetical protein
MSFNVGDIVDLGIRGGTQYEVMEASTTQIKPRATESAHVYGWHDNSLFTLVTPAGPPPSVLTGMTQFFKDKEKSNVT